MPDVSIIDATLREGAQTPGVRFRREDVIAIAQALADCGVDAIEIGHPRAGEGQERLVATVVALGLPCPVLAHARAVPDDVEAVARTGAPWVGIFLGINALSRRVRLARAPSFDDVLSMIDASLGRAKRLGLRARFTVEDASRTPFDELHAAFACAVAAGADRICWADSVGVCEPAETSAKVAAIRAALPRSPLEVHVHNDRGLALAGALAAIDAGASWVSASVLGIGERCGIVDTLALIANLHHRGQRPLPPPGALLRAAARVTAATGIAPWALAPVVGENAFTHTARLHVLATERDELAYSWTAPSALGRATKMGPR